MEHVGNDTARVYVKYLRCDKTHLSKHNCIIRTNSINLVLDAPHVFMFFHEVYENSMHNVQDCLFCWTNGGSQLKKGQRIPSI